MLIFPKHGLAYLATPKTGTTALEAALRKHAEVIFSKRRKHLTAARYRNKVAPFFADAFGYQTETVAVMRNPIDQIRSWYRYRARVEKQGDPKSTHGKSFDDFVTAVCAQEPPRFARIGSQYEFLTDHGELAVDHLFSYDNQAGLIGFLTDRLDTLILPDQINVSPPMEAPLSPQVEALLRRHRAAEFALFDRLTTAGGRLSAAP